MAVTGTVAAVSVGLLAAALGSGWLGPDVWRGATFCEAAVHGPVVQPANTWSNAGFVVAGLVIAWRAGDVERRGATFTRYPALATCFACLVVLLGPGSAAMHATQSALGGHLDVLSMYLVAGFAAAYALMRWTRRGPGTFAAVLAALVLACELVGRWDREIPVVMFSGNLAFGVLLVLAVTLEVRIARRGEVSLDLRYAWLAVAAMAAAFAIWNLSRHGLCRPHSLLQGHAAWHLLNALAAYLLYRLYASERAPADR